MKRLYVRIACRSNWRRAIQFVALLVVSCAPAAAQDRAPLPLLDDADHLGVATCAGSTCHGAGRPTTGSDVLQNEFLTWHRKDAHAKAYAVLRSDRSQRIADRLGLGPATESDTCLDCHADNVPPAQRGDRFQISDGVGCEACHGGSGEWIRAHTDDRTSHQDNIDNGLYPTDQPAARTRLCMACHYSNPKSPMTHRIMAAGHPALLFETDTFSRIRPPHHRVDADYRQRKTVASAARTWAVGQAVAAGIKVRHVRDDLARDGLFPELYYFSCRSCHHETGDAAWVSRPIVATAPGSVRFEDATWRMLGHVLAELAPASGERWLEALERLQRSQGEGTAAVRDAAQRLERLARDASKQVAGMQLDTAGVRGIAAHIVGAGVTSGYADRAWCNQASMALAALVDTLEEQSALTGSDLARLRGTLDRLFDALASPYGHEPERVRRILQAMEPEF